MTKGKKIGLSIGAVVGIALIAAAGYWFSMSVEARNMILFMMLGGESYNTYEEYQVIDRNDNALVPTAFEITTTDNDTEVLNTNIVTVTEMVKNENSKMAKKGMMKTTGVDDYTGWHVIADEGAKEGENPFGPSPLSYYTAGIASNLHVQILKAAEIKGVELDNVTVEVLNNFYWDDMMAPDGAGFLDKSITNIIIESNLSEAIIQEIKDIALNAWTAGEALRNKTEVIPTLIVNGDNWGTYKATPGTSLSDESVVGDLKVSSVTETPRKPEYAALTPKEDEGMSFSGMTNMSFEIFAIAESADNKERPYLTKITLSTPTPETWEVYSDEFMGENDVPLAPTSLEYFTVGVSLCLTSQTTLVSAMMGLDYTDYRVEHQFDYRLEDENTPEIHGYTDTVHTYVLVESDESAERLETFYKKALSLCFAGEGLVTETDMRTSLYLNGKEVK